MRRALCAVSLLGLVVAASAEVEVRFWVTTQPPNTGDGGNIAFRPGYGPFTPYAGGMNYEGYYYIHRNYVSSSNPGSVATPKFAASDLPDVVEPRDLPAGMPVYLWAGFCGPGDADPIQPLLGWEDAGVRVGAMNLRLVTTGTLTVSPIWYQYEIWTGSPPNRVGTRWVTSSDMSGNMVTMVALSSATGWGADSVIERMQTAVSDEGYGGYGSYYAGGILLGVIQHTGGEGDLYIGMGYKGLWSPTGVVTYFPGTELTGITGTTVFDTNAPPRIGQTPEATWYNPEAPEPVSLALLALGALILRRR